MATFLEDQKLIQHEINKEMKDSYIDYAMSVIVGRALPDVRDGLKPVHRRILYGMDGLGVTPDKPHKKSARIVGEVMGKYHPHGDSSIYDAMVRMAQPFNIRYTLVDGHGNFGSVDGDGAAAMRYTEARMSPFSLQMIRDIEKETVNFVPNFDGEEKELGFTLTEVDGLPVIPIERLCKELGYKFTVNENDEIIIETPSLTYFDELDKNSALGVWEFNTPGYVEGWRSDYMHLQTDKGYIRAVSNSDFTDPIIWSKSGIAISAAPETV